MVRSIPRDSVCAVVDELFTAWRASRTVFIIGNGGSATTASHMMNDLNKFTEMPGQRRFRAMALTDNIPLLTAVANDLAYSEIFVEPLKNFLQPDDRVIALSASGNSPNIVKAVQYAREQGARVIGFCGHPGGRLAELADLKVVIPASHIGHQEDGHLILNHVISVALQERVREYAAT